MKALRRAGPSARVVFVAGFAVLPALLALGARADDARDDEPPPRSGSLASGRAVSRSTGLFSRMNEVALDSELARRRRGARSYPELIERVTEGLLSAPYVLSPLGEGSPPDEDPRFRLDAFDCTTFVETSIALARGNDLADAKSLLDQIRYIDGEPTFEARRHLMSTEWVPGLIQQGFLADVTAKIGGERTRYIELEMTEQRWKQRRVARTLKLPIARVPMGQFRIPYLSLEDAIAAQRRIPAGTVINIIRRDVPSSPDVITHQGLIVMHPGDARRYVRHASPVARRVIDEELVHMMTRYEKPRKWPIIGAQFLTVVDARRND